MDFLNLTKMLSKLPNYAFELLVSDKSKLEAYSSFIMYSYQYRGKLG